MNLRPSAGFPPGALRRFRLQLRDKTMRSIACALALCVAPLSAAAGEALLGLGYEGLGDTSEGAGLASVDYWVEPRINLGPAGLTLGAAAEADTQADLWAGFGPVLLVPLSDWRVEAAAFPGVYVRGPDGTDLGETIMFRLLLGVSREIRPGCRAGAYLQHKSNASIGDENPGIESVLARVGRRF